MDTRSKLRKACRERRLVRFERRFEDSTVTGYAVDLGPEYFLLALVSDRIRFDGFEVLRISDVRKLRSDTRRIFVERALELRKERMPRRPTLDMSSASTILESATRAAPLISVHHEADNPEVCWIGRVTAIGGGWFAMQKIKPSAHWDRSVRWFPVKGVTRVCFGGDYESALHLVAGKPPSPR